MKRTIVAFLSALFFGIVALGAVTQPAAQITPAPDDPVIAGAGDIATSGVGDEATAKLLDSINPTVVYTTGDNAYPNGTLSEFQTYYEPTWGRHKAKTKPSPGNHEHNTSGASGYYDYFGAAAGERGKGYYSYDVGEWHLIALNSSISMGATSEQVGWLKNDLAAHANSCTLAYFHHPLFSSGAHGNQTQVKPLWDALYAANADVVLNGHEHNYERFAPQNPSGTLDTARGIREFVVGMGGASTRPFDIIKPNSETRSTGTYGVLKLTLHASGYDWEFVPEAGKTFTDSGSDDCHDASGSPTDAPVITAPANNSYDTDGIITFSGTAEAGSTVKLFEGATPKGTITADSSGNWSGPTLSDVSNGLHTYTVNATDAVGNTSADSDAVTVTVDSVAPTVKSLVATKRTSTGVPLRKTNFKATFNEKMTKATLNKVTFTFYKCTSTACSTTPLSATVTPRSDVLSATLNPFGSTSSILLAANTKYKVEVSTGAKDLAGNALDHDPSTAGNQTKVAYFKTGSS